MNLLQQRKAEARAALAEKKTAAPVEPLALVKPEPKNEPAGSIRGLLENIGGEAQAASKEDTAKRITGVVRNTPAYESQYGTFFIEAAYPDRRVWLQLETQACRDYLTKILVQAGGGSPPKKAIDDFEVSLRIAARESGRKIKIAYRVAKCQDGYAVDLGGKVVVISSGAWHINDNSSAPFIRGRGYGILPDPIKPLNVRAALELLIKWLINIGVPKKCSLVVVVTLADWLRAGGAYPVLALYGAPGCFKTTIAKMILMLIDPTESGGLPSIKLDADSIAAGAQQRHVLTFDNLSKLNAEIQDLLCICSTGGEIIARLLYTNGDVAILPIHRPALITSVQGVVTRPDLMSRSVLVELAARTGGERRGETEIINEFMELRPALLGALLELVAAGFGGTTGVQHGHRLVELVEFGESVVIAAGLEEGAFIRSMDAMRASAGAELAESDTFIVAVRAVLKEQVAGAGDADSFPGYRSWQGVGCVAKRVAGVAVFGARAEWLLNAVKRKYPIGSVNDWMPKDKRELSGALLRTTPLFEAVGIQVAKREPSRGHVHWEFTVTED